MCLSDLPAVISAGEVYLQVRNPKTLNPIHP